MAPVFILMEDVVLKKMREIVGYKGGDGIFTPGTTILLCLPSAVTSVETKFQSALFVQSIIIYLENLWEAAVSKYYLL